MPAESGRLFAGTACFPGVKAKADFCRHLGHEVTILFADITSAVEHAEVQSWRDAGFAVHSLAREKVDPATFFPNLLKNAWLTYQWLKQRDFDRIFFRDDSSAGLIAFAAKRLGEAFASTRLIYQLNGPASWSVHLRDRGQLIRDDLTLPYSVQYGVENADQLIVPADYFLERIRQSGWRPSGRVIVLPDLAPVRPAPREAPPAGAPLQLIYPVHDSDHASLTIFLQAVATLAGEGIKLRVTFLCYGNPKEQRAAAKRVRRLVTEAQAAAVPCEIIDGAAGLPAGSDPILWLFSPLWLNLPFLILEAANCGEPLLVARAAGSEHIVDEENCLVDWARAPLAAALARCLAGDLPRPAALPRAAAEQAWQETLCDPAPEPAPPAKNPDDLRVSVCVAHFNKALYLREALDSLRAQTHRNLEVIVVDDASTDPDSRAVFEDAAVTFSSPDWKFIREKVNRGPGHARNRAVEEATGSHLVFFDADDVAFPDMVERLLRGVVRTGGDCVAASSRRLRESAGERFSEGTSTYVGGSLENAFLAPPAGTVFIVRREMFDAVGGFKTDLPRDCHEDWNFHVRLLAHEYRLHVLPEPVFAYRYLPLSRSLLVSQNIALVVEPFLESTPQVQKNLLNSAIERAGALETAVRLLADYEQFADGIRYLRRWNRLKKSLLRPFTPRHKR